MGLLDKLKESIKNPRIMVPLNYLGGHPDLKNPEPVAVGKENDNLILYGGLKIKPLLSIPKKDIVNITLEKASKHSLGKAAAGAIIGGVLTGGIGAITGAAIGGRKKDDSIIVLTVKYGQSTMELFFGGNNVSQKYSQFVALLR